MKRQALILWFVLVILLSAGVARTSVKAQQGCSMGWNMWGMHAMAICVPGETCKYPPDVCETDYCVSVSCGQGMQSFCISEDWCGDIPGCWEVCP